MTFVKFNLIIYNIIYFLNNEGRRDPFITHQGLHIKLGLTSVIKHYTKIHDCISIKKNLSILHSF